MRQIGSYRPDLAVLILQRPCRGAVIMPLLRSGLARALPVVVLTAVVALGTLPACSARLVTVNFQYDNHNYTATIPETSTKKAGNVEQISALKSQGFIESMEVGTGKVYFFKPTAAILPSLVRNDPELVGFDGKR